jgi:hypothetical protein
LVMRGAVKNKVIAKEIDRTKKLIYAALSSCLPGAS